MAAGQWIAQWGLHLNSQPVEYVLVANDDAFIILEARIDGIRVGRAVCSRDGGRLQLGDIEVELEMPRSHRSLASRLTRRLTGCTPMQLRGRGIGRELLKRVLQAADSAGVSEVWGNVTQADLERSPFLLTWYQRYGFELEATDDESVQGSVCKVVRR